MTIFDRARGARRIRIDVSQLADELSKRVPDLDQVDLGKAREAAGTAVHDVADRARHSLESAGERARTLRTDLAHAGDKASGDHPLDDIGQRIRSVASSGALGTLVARLERELPDTDKDRYARAYERGRVQARTRFLLVGMIAGLAAGVAGAFLLDPTAGKARRDALVRKVSSLTSGLQRQAAGQAKFAQDRARGLAIERGLVKPDREPVAVMDTSATMTTSVAAPAWPATEGPVAEPLDSPQFGAHEALPEELVATAQPVEVTDPADPTVRA